MISPYMRHSRLATELIRHVRDFATPVSGRRGYRRRPSRGFSTATPHSPLDNGWAAGIAS
jgi:hypothetical protein